jgi:isopentenyldiphosphate isomerase
VSDLVLDADEVESVRWIGVDDLALELAKHPARFSVWSPMVLSMALADLSQGTC